MFEGDVRVVILLKPHSFKTRRFPHFPPKFGSVQRQPDVSSLFPKKTGSLPKTGPPAFPFGSTGPRRRPFFQAPGGGRRGGAGPGVGHLGGAGLLAAGGAVRPLAGGKEADVTGRVPCRVGIYPGICLDLNPGLFLLFRFLQVDFNPGVSEVDFNPGVPFHLDLKPRVG